MKDTAKKSELYKNQETIQCPIQPFSEWEGPSTIATTTFLHVPNCPEKKSLKKTEKEGVNA